MTTDARPLLTPGRVDAAWRWTACVASWRSLLAMFVRIGGDWDWLVALGDHVRADR